MITIYGIKNCATMKKAFETLDKLGAAYEFFDYKKEPISKEVLADWVRREGLDVILNKKGLTWRKVSDDDKQKALHDTKFALSLMMNQPSMIKRPILSDEHNRLLVGFDEAAFEQFVKNNAHSDG